MLPHAIRLVFEWLDGPAGPVKPLDEVVAPVIEKDKRDKKDGGKTQDQKPGDASNLNVKSTRRPRAGENKCDHCVLDLCQAKVWAGSAADHKSKCLVYSMVDPSKPIPHHAPSGDKAPTKTELMALTVCQLAVKKRPEAGPQNGFDHVLPQAVRHR